MGTAIEPVEQEQSMQSTVGIHQEHPIDVKKDSEVGGTSPRYTRIIVVKQ